MSLASTRISVTTETSASPSGWRAFMRGQRSRATLDGLLFLGPFLVVYALFVLVPVAQAIRMSMFDWDLLGGTQTFVGLANFQRMLGGRDLAWSLDNQWLLRSVLLLGAAALAARAVRRRTVSRDLVVTLAAVILLVVALGVHPTPQGFFSDAVFWISLRHTIEFTVFSTPILIALGLALALALNTSHRGTGFYQAVFFLPYILPVSVTTLIWGYLLNPDRGILAAFLHQFGLAPAAWLSDPNLALPAIIATTVWWTVGFNLVLFLAGLQDIDPALYEASSLDGANAWQRFLHITLPGLQHVTIFVGVTQVIASFQIFGQVYILTRGGPGDATRVLIQHVYETGFRDFQLGYASAVSLFLLVAMMAVSGVQFRVLTGGQDA